MCSLDPTSRSRSTACGLHLHPAKAVRNHTTGIFGHTCLVLPTSGMEPALSSVLLLQIPLQISINEKRALENAVSISELTFTILAPLKSRDLIWTVPRKNILTLPEFLG
jgi:hypothetical protein